MYAMREQVRYKMYYNYAKLKEICTDNPVMMGVYANYSQLCFVDTLNKENQSRLRILMDPTTPMQKYIDGVGYKVPYKYASKKDAEGPIVYVIDGAVKRAGQSDTGRETINLRRVRWANVSEYDKCAWINGDYVKLEKAEGWMKHVRHQYPNPVFMDRLTKKEKDKLAMLLLMPDDVYLEGIGSVRTSHTGDRLYFMEVDYEEE
jgi:hypothetical protein